MKRNCAVLLLVTVALVMRAPVSNAQKIDAVTQIRNLPSVIVTSFPGATFDVQANACLASFPTGTGGNCVALPGAYTSTNPIFTSSGRYLSCAGRAFPPGGGADAPSTCSLAYNGPPATSAIVIGYSDYSPSNFAGAEGFTITSMAASSCVNDGELMWNPGSVATNKWNCGAFGNAVTVTGATNATPIVLTVTSTTGIVTGDQVLVSHVLGNNTANGQFAVTVVNGTTLSLDTSVGSGTYTSGGQIQKITYTAATVHLSAIQLGQTNPTSLVDPAWITVKNMRIVGNAVDESQGGFQFGVYANGAELSSFNDIEVSGADVGALLGPQFNGDVVTSLSVRFNRRAGLQISGQNNFTSINLIAESNQWFDNRGTDVDKYGHGILGQAEPNVGTLANGAQFIGTYFENNDCDLCSPSHVAFGINVGQSTRPFNSGMFSDRAFWYGSNLSGCTGTVDPALSLAGKLVTDCTYTGTYPYFRGSGQPYIIVQMTQQSNPLVQKIQVPAADGHNISTVYEAHLDQTGGTNFFHYRLRGAGAVAFDPYVTANAVDTFVESTIAQFTGSVWDGGGSVNVDKLFTIREVPSTTVGKLSFRDNSGTSVMDLVDGGAVIAAAITPLDAPPTATPLTAAGTGATCAAQSNGIAHMSAMGGQIVLVTGSGSWGTGDQCKLSGAHFARNTVTISPADAATAALFATRQPYVNLVNDGDDYYPTVGFTVADDGAHTYTFNYSGDPTN